MENQTNSWLFAQKDWLSRLSAPMITFRSSGPTTPVVPPAELQQLQVSRNIQVFGGRFSNINSSCFQDTSDFIGHVKKISSLLQLHNMSVISILQQEKLRLRFQQPAWSWHPAVYLPHPGPKTASTRWDPRWLNNWKDSNKLFIFPGETRVNLWNNWFFGIW